MRWQAWMLAASLGLFPVMGLAQSEPADVEAEAEAVSLDAALDANEVGVADDVALEAEDLSLDDPAAAALESPPAAALDPPEGAALDPDAEPVAEPAEKPAVLLDDLLKLPDNLDLAVERRGRATETEWRTRFREAREALENAQADLAASQAALEKTAQGSDQWQFAPPGLPAQADGNIDSHRLRQRIKRSRGEVERAEHAVQELEVEANLANVPKAWRE